MKIRRIIAVFLMMFLLFPGNVYKIKAADEFKVLSPKYNIAPDHEFTIQLSKELDESSLKEGNVKVYDKATLEAVAIEVRRDTYDATKIKIKGVEPFKGGKTYTIEVSNLRSKKNNYFKQAIKMDFTIKSKYSGLPAENGLIIVEDKAYAIDYLIRNIKMVNEITAKPYDIYYIYDVNYQKIYSLLNPGTVSGGNIDYPEMKYIDPDGKTHIYRWREDKQEFQLSEPKANVDVIVRSDAKTISVNVKSVISVPNAKYYKLRNSNLIKNFGEPILYIASDNIEEISVLSEDKSVLAKGIVSIDKNSTGEVRLKLSEDDDLGNTAANINNNGIALEDSDGYIYYVSSADKEKLYKQSVGGTFNRMILEDKAQYINGSGDWLYYSNYSDGGKLYRIKKDGTQRTKLLDDKAAYITLSGQYIYYSNHSDGGKLYKIRKDASDAKVLGDNTKHGNILTMDYGNYDGIVDEVAFINIVGDWIYYSSYTDGHKIYAIHKDGTYRGKLTDVYGDSVQVEDDWVYFTSDSGVISKVNKSGGGSVIPIRGRTSEYNKGYHINVNGDWIFFSNAEDGGKLYKISTDGSGSKIKLSDEAAGYINIVGDWIYFTTTKNKLFKLPLDSKGDQKAVEVAGVKDANKITQVEDVYVTVEFEDVNKTTEWIENKYLPDKVPAIMGDNTIQQLVVVWDRTKVSVKDGIRTYTGTLVGYGQTVKLFMKIPSEMLNDTNNITVYKSGSNNDMVIVDGNATPVDNTKTRVRIAEKDVIKVYEDYNKTKLLGTGTVGKDGKAVISKINLDTYGDSFYITVTRVNKAESNPTEVNQYAVPILNYENVLDKDVVGLGADTRDLTINVWTPAKANATNKKFMDANFILYNQDIYMLPTRAVLDMTKHKPVVPNLSITTSSWDGSILTAESPLCVNKDSQGSAFKSGNYDVYVSAYYTGVAHPDIDNFKPKVEGRIANARIATYLITEEGIPAKPTIAVQRVQGRETSTGPISTKTNAQVTLTKAPLLGETAWLVPVELVSEVKGWRAQDGPSPFETLYNNGNGEDLVKFSGPGLIMPSPKGDTGPNFFDKEYKLFIVNAIGASVESDNKIIVDNSKPLVNLTQSSTTYPVGAPINASTNEKGKIYVVSDVVDVYSLTPKILEEAVKGKSALVMPASGSSVPVSILKSETLWDFNIGGTTTDPDYNIVSVDEAGNISEPKPIKIKRNVDDLEGAINEARDYVKEHPNDPGINDIINLINKADTLYNKPTATQAEIDTMTKQLNDKIGRVNFVLTVSTNDNKNVLVRSIDITANQMTVGKLKSKLVVTPGAIISVYENNVEITDMTRLLTNDMTVKAYLPNTTQEANYKVIVNRAYDVASKEELLHALNVNKLSDITLSVGTILLDQDIVFERPTTIVGNSGNLTGSENSNIVLGNSVKLINSSNLIIKKVNFIGEADPSGRAMEAINNTKYLQIENCNFTGFKFNSDGMAIIKSEAGAILKASTVSFSASAPGRTFYHLDISNSSQPGTAITNCKFSGTDGINVKGIYINGNGNSYNEIVVNKNTFTTFSSAIPNSMAIPVYIEGGKVSLSANVINSADIGVFIDIKDKSSEVNGYTLYRNISSADMATYGKKVADANNSVTKNYFGDVVVGENILGQVPYFYYNSSTTPTFMDVTITGGKIIINDSLSLGTNKFVYKQISSKSTNAPKKGAVPTDLATYSDYDIDNPPDIDLGPGGDSNYIYIMEIDNKNKVVKYREFCMP